MSAVPAGFNNPDKLDTSKLGIEEHGQRRPTISEMMMNGIGELRKKIMQPFMISGGQLLPPNNGTPVSSDGNQASGAKGSSKTNVGSGDVRKKAFKILEKKLGSDELGIDSYKKIPKDVARELVDKEISAKRALKDILESLES